VENQVKEQRELTPVVMDPKAFREVWIRQNEAVVKLDPDKILGELYDLKRQIRKVEIRVAKQSEMGSALPPIWMNKNETMMLVRVAVSGIFPEEKRPTIVEAKLLKGQNGIGTQVFQDRYNFGLAEGKGASKEDLRKIKNNYTVSGPLAGAVVGFLKAENLAKALAGTPFAEFFGTVEAPPEPVKTEAPKIEM